VLVLPAPVTAQRVRWNITALGSGLRTVGGAELAFFTIGKTEPQPTVITLKTQPVELLEKQGDKLVQRLKVTIEYPYAEETKGMLSADGAEGKAVALTFGSQTVELKVAAVESEKTVKVALRAGTPATEIAAAANLKPVRKMEIFLLPHSNNDIG